MTSYSVDTEIRQNVYLVIASLSILASYGLATVFGHNQFYKLVAPSAGALFAALLWIFDRILWRIPPISRAIGIPDLNGEWTGVVDRPTGPLQVKITITQRFHQLSIVLESNLTRSTSEVAGMFVEEPRQVTVHYTYIVRYIAGPEAGRVYGNGTNLLVLSKQENKISLCGPYYSSNSRNGRVEVTKVDH